MQKLVEVVEMESFQRRAEALLTEEERTALIWHLAANPTFGDVIPGTGGIRKVRFMAKGRGKSGGVRVIYFFVDDETPLYALMIYAKNERADLTPMQKRAMAKFASDIKNSRRRRRRA